MKHEDNLEPKILAAAEELFIEKGFAATSTTDIAKRVGCNQSLVHYYFRTKEKLFQGIFQQKVELLLGQANQYSWEGSFFQVLEQVVTIYFEMLKNNRRLPFFIINELIANEERRTFIREHIIQNVVRQRAYYHVDKIIQGEVVKGTLRPIATIDLILNVGSMAVGSFIILPIYKDWLAKTDDEIDEFITHRKEEVIRMAINGLKP